MRRANGGVVLERDLDLTERQRQVLRLITDGMTNAEIGEALGISLDGAKWHVSEILSKLDVSTRDEAAEYWRARNGLRLRFTRALRALIPGFGWVKAGGAIAVVGVVSTATIFVVVAVRDSGTSDGHAPAAPPTTAAAAASLDWSHRFAVYSAVDRLNQNSPRSLVVTWDLDSGKLASSFEYGDKGEAGIAAVLAGHDVVFATRTHVVQSSLDGTMRRQVFAASDDSPLQDIAVSPDGRLVAIVTSATLQPGTLHVLDIQTLQERLVVQQSDTRLAGMRGSFWQVRWRDDGQGVLIHTATYSEMYGSLATIFLDGRVRLEDVQGYGNVSPTGRMRAGDVGEIGCMWVGSHELVIRDLDLGKILVRATSPSTVYTPWEWSPDGTQFVFLQQEATACDQLSADKSVAYMVQTNGGSFGAPSRVSDLAALHRQWHGNRLFTADCDMGNEPVVDRTGNLSLYCRVESGPDPEVTVRVGGVPVGTAISPAPLGVITP